MNSEQINNNTMFVPISFLLNDFTEFLIYFCEQCSFFNETEIYTLLNDIKSNLEKNKKDILNFEEIYCLLENFINKFFIIIGKNIDKIQGIEKIKNIEIFFEYFRKKNYLNLEQEFKQSIIATELYLSSLIENKGSINDNTLRPKKSIYDKENFENHVKVNLLEINTQIKINHNIKIYIIKIIFSFIIYEFIIKNKDLFKDKIGSTYKFKDYNNKLLKNESDKFFKIRIVINSIMLAFEEYKAIRGEAKALQKFSNFIELHCGKYRVKKIRNQEFFYHYHIDYLFYIINVELLEIMYNYRVVSKTSLAENILIKKLKYLNYNGVFICKIFYYKKSTFSFLSIPVVFSAEANNNELNNYIKCKKNEIKFIECHTKHLLKNYGNIRLMKDFNATVSKIFYVSLSQESFLLDVISDEDCYFKNLFSYLLIFSELHYKNYIYKEEEEKKSKILRNQNNANKDLISNFNRSRDNSLFHSLGKAKTEQKTGRLFSSFREVTKKNCVTALSRPVSPVFVNKNQLPDTSVALLTTTAKNVNHVKDYFMKSSDSLQKQTAEEDSVLLNSVIAEIFQEKKIFYRVSLNKIKNFINNPKIKKCLLNLKNRCNLQDIEKIKKLRYFWDNPKKFLKKDKKTIKDFFVKELISAFEDNALCSIEEFKRKCFIMIIVLDKKDKQKILLHLFKSDEKYYNIIEKSCEKIKNVNFEELPSKKDVRLIEIIYYLIAIVCTIKY